MCRGDEELWRVERGGVPGLWTRGGPATLPRLVKGVRPTEKVHPAPRTAAWSSGDVTQHQTSTHTWKCRCRKQCTPKRVQRQQSSPRTAWGLHCALLDGSSGTLETSNKRKCTLHPPDMKEITPNELSYPGTGNCTLH